MRYAFFPGCKIPHLLEAYGRSARVVLAELGVELVEMEFNCCGYPARHVDFLAFVLSAGRNLARAEGEGLDILTPCKCCFGSLRHATHWLRERERLRAEVNELLGEEGLRWEGTAEAHHLLTVLGRQVGLERLRDRVRRPLQGLSVAAHYGCHALRPGNIVRFDNPLAPTLFEDLVEATGARAVPWSRRLECCGQPLMDKNTALSTTLAEKKLAAAEQAGADCVCTACTYCQMQFDAPPVAGPGRAQWPRLPSILYTHLLGLSLGLSAEILGMDPDRVAELPIER